MLFTPYALTNRTTRTIRTVDGVDMIEFSGLSTGLREFSIVTKLEDAQRWVNGELIQTAFPYLNADDREILKTGIDSESWDRMFPELVEDE